jgi:hypothetical protein
MKKKFSEVVLSGQRTGKIQDTSSLTFGSAGFGFDCALFRERVRFRVTLRLRAAVAAFCFPDADACRFDDASRSLRRFFSSKYFLNFL